MKTNFSVLTCSELLRWGISIEGMDAEMCQDYAKEIVLRYEQLRDKIEELDTRVACLGFDLEVNEQWAEILESINGEL